MKIAGIDEAGRGPLCGPVVAAAVIFPPSFNKNSIFHEITDSKKLSHRKRFELSCEIKIWCEYSIVAVGHTRIDKLNIRNATKLAMSLALSKINADKALIDGNMEIDTELPQETIIGGDALVPEISAASILAKVWRDELMIKLAIKYPGYGFEKHAGYPTKFHRDAVKVLGPCRVHRKTFSGVKEYLLSKDSDSGFAQIAVNEGQ